MPDNPAAWLYRVARNLALDRLRRATRFRGKEAALKESLLEATPEDPSAVYLEGEITDDQLRLIFLCCHPELPQDARVALTLKTVVGFGVQEIARAFLSKETTIAQRLVRAQRRIRERRLPFEVPPPEELPGRVDAVIEVIYLLFNEGYGASDGDALVRTDLCTEALRLVEQLAENPRSGGPSVHALASLLFFQASRLPARVDGGGELVRLHEQDRTLWDRRAIHRAFHHLERAMGGECQTGYHLQAAIAAHHAAAATAEATDWASILGLYDQLYALNQSPIVALNRAVAVARVQGPEAGLEAIEALHGHPAVREYYLLGATRGELLISAGRLDEATEAYARALECPCSEPERRFLLRCLRALEEDGMG